VHLLPPHRDEVLSRPGGRQLGWAEYGDPDGRPILAFHGTPSSRLAMGSLHEAAVEQGVRIVAPDRPGIGSSTSFDGFGLLDWPREVWALVDHLELDSFAVLGVSGGGPYALACGVEPDQRLRLIATAGGAAPYDRTDATRGVTASDRVTEILAQRWPWASGVVLSAMVLSARLTPRLAWWAWELELSAGDRVALRRFPVGQRLAPFVDGLRSGVQGTVEDFRLLAGDWGFLPEEVRVHTVLWHGAEDPTVPLHHAQDLAARVPCSELLVVPGAGHLLTATRPDDLLAGIVRRLDGVGRR